MKHTVFYLFVFHACIVLSFGSTFTWNSATCPDSFWDAQTSVRCWSPIGTPGPFDDVVIPQGANVTIANTTGPLYPTTYYVYSDNILFIHVHSIFIAKGSIVTITDQVSLYIEAASYVDVDATLIIQAYIGALDGPGSLDVYGNLLLHAGNIQGTGHLTIQPSGTFNISNTAVKAWVVREAYLMRNVTIFGRSFTLQGSVIHAGFWWQRTNITITLATGGVWTLGGFFSKHFEQTTLAWGPLGCGGTIYVNPGASLYLGGQELYLLNIVNNGTVYTWFPASNNTVIYNYNFPYGANFYNYGKVVQYAVSIPRESYFGVATCEELREFAKNGRGQDLTIYVDFFAKLGPLDCGVSLEIRDATLRFAGHGGLIFAENVRLVNAVMEVDAGVDVVFIQQFHANDSRIYVSESSNVKLMYMPKGFPDGYHNYMDKSVLFWPTGQKKISFAGVTIEGGGGIDFLSELNLEGAGLVVRDGEVYFQREFGASAVTGSGNLVVLDNGFVSFGIESSLNGTGVVEVFGKAEIPEIASVRSERRFVIHQGANFNVEGIFIGVQ